jgi:hypothetical protein
MAKWYQRIPKKIAVGALGAAIQLLPWGTQDQKNHVTTLAGFLILGIGAADFGKEAKKVEARLASEIIDSGRPQITAPLPR